MTFLPAHTVIGATGRTPARSAFLLHGIFGSGRNWKTFAGRLAAACPDWSIALVDLREHGASQGAPPPHTLAACAGDLAELARSLGRAPAAVLGHSFGGKVALAYAAAAPDALEQVVLLDSPPGAQAAHGDPLESTEAGRVLRVMQRMQVPVESRAAASAELARQGIPTSVAGWMATNLVPSGAGYAWHFDLGALEALLLDYWRTDGYALLRALPQRLAVHQVRAADSDRWPPRERADLAREVASGRVVEHVLEGAGHWLHIDNPGGLLALLAPLLSAPAPA